MINLLLTCCMCNESKEIKIENKGWGDIDIYEEHAFCPTHSIIQDFFHNQCLGCVGGRGDCSLYRSFMRKEMKLSESDLDKIKIGICPKS